MKVSVVIPTGRTRERVAATIQSCVAQELPESFEVIVIANPPSPELEQWLDGVGVAGAEVRYIPCEVRSANVARNHGLEAARGEIVYFLDDDCRLPTVHHLRDLVRLHDQAPEVLGIGGPYRSPDAAPRSTVFYNAYTEMWLRRNGTPAGEQLVLAGGNASYKRRLGGDDLIFDDALAYGGTETEFNHRLVVRGHSLRLDDAMTVVHDFREPLRRLFWRAWRQGAGRRADSNDTAAKSGRGGRDARPRVNRPRPRWAFALFVLGYYIVVRLGAVFGRRDPVSPEVVHR